MTPVETIVGGILLAIFSWLLGSFLGGKDKVSSEDFKNHVDSEAPHHACPVHTAQLSDMKKVLDRVDRRVYKLVGGRGVIDEEND